MIRYPVTLAELQAKVGKAWLKKAAERTEAFRKLGRYEESSSIWSEVKPHYMALQHEKCAYCERKLESADYGLIEQDVEHFRPKSSVTTWKPPASLSGVPVTPVPAGQTGYHLLPYHLLNYAAACKPCNSALKSDYFPIAGTYQFSGGDPKALMKNERPYLLYPIGSVDVDPATLFGFNGVSPCPTPKAKGAARDRVRVTIEFFKLDDVVSRKNLVLERARCLVALYPQLAALANPAATARDKARAQKAVDGFTDDAAPHANCSRRFCDLFKANPARAGDFYDAALDLVAGSS